MAREAVIIESKRTALTKAHRGSFNMTSPVDYTAHCIKEVVGAAENLDPAEIGDVVLGCGHPEGVMGMNMGRIAAMAAGLPVSVPGTTVNRFCSSGSQAVMMAAHQILNEGAEVAGRRRRRDHHDDAGRLPEHVAHGATTTRKEPGSRASTTRWASRPRSSPSATTSRARTRTPTRSKSQQRYAAAFQDAGLRSPRRSHR